MDAVESLKEKMVLVCKVLQDQRVVDVYGHVSARLPGERILSTPHMPPGKVALRDLIVLDMNGKKIEGFGEPNGETAMHTSIYKARADVQCILHYHPDDGCSGEHCRTRDQSGRQLRRAFLSRHADLRFPRADPQRNWEIKSPQPSGIETRCCCEGMVGRWWPIISTRCCCSDS